MRKPNRRSSGFPKLEYHSLEGRHLLAGNVSVFVDSDILLILGDSNANRIELTQEGASYIITGIDTTINNRSEPAIISNAIRHVTIAMGDGDDQVTVTEVLVPGNFSFFGGAGNDRLETSELIANHFHLEGNDGDDAFLLNFASGNSAYLYLGSGNNSVSTSNLVVGRNFKVFGQQGNNTFVSNGLSVNRKLEIRMEGGNDQVLFSGDTRVRNQAQINLGGGNDFVGLLPTTDGTRAEFRKSLLLNPGSGINQVAFDAGVTNLKNFRVQSGRGTTSVNMGGNPQTVRGLANAPVLSDEALGSVIDDVFSRLEQAGIGGETDVVPLTAVATTSTLEFTENGAPLLIDPSFSLAGSKTVTGATIQINNFAADQESLTFPNQGNIAGAFDSVTGTLTLSGNASAADYQAAIRSIVYQNTSNNPVTTLRSIAFAVRTFEETVNVTRNLAIIAVNDPPTLTTTKANQTVRPTDLPLVFDAALVITDPDSANLVSATISIVGGLVADEDELSVEVLGDITLSSNSTSSQLELSGSAPLAIWQSVLRTLTFASTSENPTVGARTIRVTLNDGVDGQSTDFTLNVADEAGANQFNLLRSAVNGTVVGRVVGESTTSPARFQIVNDDLAPEFIIKADDHLSGSQTASIILIEYFDLECPACQEIHSTINDLVSQFEDDLLVIRRHLPLESPHPNARAAAIAAEAAHRQGKFPEMVDLLFEQQDSWKGISNPTEQFEEYAETVGLNLEQFRSDIADPALNARVTRDQLEAQSLGYNNTPTFILQGVTIENAGVEGGFPLVIENALVNLNQAFAINRQTGDLIVRDASLLGSLTSPVTIKVAVIGASGSPEIVEVTILVS